MQLGTTRTGERDHPLVGPALLTHQPPANQTIVFQTVQLAVELLWRGRPEVRDRDAEPLGELVPPRLPFQQGGQDPRPDAAIKLTRHDVVFRSPVVFRPYQGREALRTILEAVTSMFEDFRYVREIGEAGSRDQVLVFEARIDDKQVEGADFIRLDDDGAISELTVMVRPMSGMQSLAQAMKDRLAAMDAVEVKE